MNQPLAIKAIFDRWIALWPGLSGGVDYTVEDIPKAEPDNALFAHVSVVDGISEDYTLGPQGTQQRTGYIEVRLTGPSGRGRKDLDRLVQYVRQIYERKRFGNDPTIGEYGIRTFGASANDPRRDKDSNQLCIMLVRIPCEWFEQVPTP